MHRLNEVASTQDEARARFDNRGPVLVVARRQFRGRGRSGNAWEHAPRATAASIALRPEWPPDALGVVPLLAGMAGLGVVSSAFGTQLSLKWPNDLMLGDEKVGGVLVEVSDGVVVAGCGINVWWPDPPEGVAALVATDPGSDRTLDLAEAWGEAALDAIAAGPSAWDPASYAAVCSTLGQDLEWDPGGAGRAVGIAPDGGLIVETDKGPTTLRSGAVRTVRTRPRS
jgi:BirA family biotin operon repressor/biotin-[acetyl-CoA-carboxylase] ligase